MKLPEGEKAIVDGRKIREYLVSRSHPAGRFKAQFFANLGFGPPNWQVVAPAILRRATNDDARHVEEAEHGRECSVPGTLTGPQGRSADVVSVWNVRVGDDGPRLVTVYPR